MMLCPAQSGDSPSTRSYIDRISTLSQELAELHEFIKDTAPLDLGPILNIPTQRKFRQDSKVLSQFEEYDQWLGQIGAIEAQLRASTRLLERRRENLRFMLSPMYVMPSEVLREILCHAPRPEILALVSKEWRTLALDNSSIWKDLNLAWPDQLVDAFMKRAKNRTVHAFFGMFEQQIWKWYRATHVQDLKEVSRRCHSLSISIPAHRTNVTFMQDLFDRFEMEKLEMLDLAIRPLNEESLDEDPFEITLPTNLPAPQKLARLHLYLVHIPNIERLTANLVELTISRAFLTIGQWLRLLVSAPRLESIAVAVDTAIIWDDDDALLITIRNNVTMPNLRRLTFRALEATDPGAISQLRLYTHHVLTPKLEEISLSQTLFPDSLQEWGEILPLFFLRVPNLKKLHMQTNGAIWPTLRATIGPVISNTIQLRSSGNPFTPFLPHLDAIHLENMGGLENEPEEADVGEHCLTVFKAVLLARAPHQQNNYSHVVLSGNWDPGLVSGFRSIAQHFVSP